MINLKTMINLKGRTIEGIEYTKDGFFLTMDDDKKYKISAYTDFEQRLLDKVGIQIIEVNN